MDFVIFCLACFGASFLVIDSKILESLRFMLADRSNFLASLLSCYFCAAVWCGLLLLSLEYLSQPLYQVISWILAGASFVYLLSSVTDRLNVK